MIKNFIKNLLGYFIALSIAEYLAEAIISKPYNIKNFPYFKITLVSLIINIITTVYINTKN